MLGIFVLTLAYLPSVMDGASSDVPSCCNGIMCPLHHLVNGHVVCNMSDGNSFQSCADYGVRYAGSLVFARVSSPMVYTVRMISDALAFQLPASPTFDMPVFSPPPRVFSH